MFAQEFLDENIGKHLKITDLICLKFGQRVCGLRFKFFFPFVIIFLGVCVEDIEAGGSLVDLF